QGELGAGGGQADVGGEGEFEADAEAVAVHGRDHRLRGPGGSGDVLAEIGEVERLDLHEPGDVPAGGEVFPLATDDDDRDVRVGVDLGEPFGHQPPHLHGDDVEAAVGEGQVGDLSVVAGLQPDVSAGQGHGRGSS